MRRPSTALKTQLELEEADDDTLPLPPTPAAAPLSSFQAVQPAIYDADSDLVAAISRLGLQDKVFVKDMIHRLAHQSSILQPPNPPGEIPQPPAPVPPKQPGIEQLSK